MLPDSFKVWLFVERDGLPYNILRDIMSNVWRCFECKKCFYKHDTFKEHRCYLLGKCKVEKREFDWIVLTAGLLHIEMDAEKSFFKLNWVVCLGKLADELGFHSPKAQEYLKKGSDHHKMWHFFEILYVALALELLTPYLKESLNNGRPSSTGGYWEWCANITDPNYVHVQYMIFLPPRFNDV